MDMPRPPRINIEGTLLEKLFGPPSYIEDLSGREKERLGDVVNMGRIFTSLVHSLRSSTEVPT